MKRLHGRPQIGALILSAQTEDSEALFEKNHLGTQLDWFRDLLSPLISPENIRMVRVLREGLPASVPEQFLILPGSGYSAQEILQQRPEYEEFLREMERQGKFHLCVCSGHQVYALVHEGGVERNPRGLEVGSKEVVLTSEAIQHSLCKGFPRTFPVNQVHFDVVTAPPHIPHKTLAVNKMCPTQAILYRNRNLTLQWHPELTPHLLRSIVMLRKDLFFPRDEAGYDTCLAGIEETPWARKLVQNFVEQIVAPGIAR